MKNASCFFEKNVAVSLGEVYNSIILLLQDVEIIQIGVSICQSGLFIWNGRVHVSCGFLIFLILVWGIIFYMEGEWKTKGDFLVMTDMRG